MKRLLFVVLCVATSALGVAGAKNDVQTLPGMAAERQRIETDRSIIERDFAASRAACYQVFFVNSCLDDADAQRRAGLSGLRRQEILLNDLERKENAAAQLRKLEEKARAASLPPNTDSGAVPAAREQPTTPSALKPQVAREASPQLPPKSGKSVGQATTSREKADARAAKAASEPGQARTFAERQSQALERRKKHEQAQRNRTKPAAQPLPVPP